MSNGKLPIIEIFGATIQGEGPVIGKKTMFVRTGGCSYSCAWCDSRFSWDGSVKATQMTPEEVWDELNKLAPDNFSHVTISGGNPALVGDVMSDFISLLHRHNITVSVETQGDKWQEWLTMVDWAVISPKPPSSKMKTDYFFLRELFERLQRDATGKYCMKVVVFDDIDYEYASYLKRYFPQIPFYLQVGNEDVTTTESIASQLLNKYEWLINKVLDDRDMNDATVLPQLHTLVYGNRKGV